MNIENCSVFKNYLAFREQLHKLLPENEGRYAVGKDGDSFECFDSYRDALERGYQKYGLGSFVVQPVRSFDLPERINTLMAA